MSAHNDFRDRSSPSATRLPALRDASTIDKSGNSSSDSLFRTEAPKKWSSGSSSLSLHDLGDDGSSGQRPSDCDEQDRLLGTSSSEIPLRAEETVSSAPYEDRPELAIASSAVAKANEQKPVTWRSLPRKGQLALLTLARLSEPLTQTSLQAYMFYQLKSFDKNVSDSTISSQAGILQGAFTATQFLTAIPWGRAADTEYLGRKYVLFIGLLGTGISALGFGFSKSFGWAVFWRCLGGALNGNIGVMRTIISEIIKEKKYQSRAFMIMPMTFNIGVILGPMLGGLLADPIGSYPGLFGPGSTFGGKTGVGWMMRWPYALPNIVSALFLTISATGVMLGLEETHEMLRDKPDAGLRFGRWLKRILFCCKTQHNYSSVPSHESDLQAEDVEMHFQSRPTSPSKPRVRQRLPLRRIWTSNVIFTLVAHGLLAMHVGTFANLWFLFLSAPRFDPLHPKPSTLKKPSPPFFFNGGLALPPPRIGLALSILGVIGISLQILVYPRVNAWIGTTRSYRLSLLLFPICYILSPYLSLLPSTTLPPHPASGAIMWIGITIILAIQVSGRTFALPGTIILVNNCCPHPSVLGTLHGIGQSVSSGMRTIGPVIGGWSFGWGLEHGIVGTAFWLIAGVAIVGAFAGTLVRDGSGHEIYLEGEEEEEAKVRERERSAT